MSDRKKLIVVLGMHRSGTSVIARGLKAMGVDLGENLLPAMAEVNERGFWEDQDFLALNVELMALSGLDWYDNCPAGRFQADDTRLEPYRSRAVQLVEDRLAIYPSFAVKDPRMAVLLPFWRAVFEQVECDVVYLIAIRNPRSVVDSIVRRDGFGAVKIYYLWLEHVLSSLLVTSGYPRVVVDYDVFMAEPIRQLERIGYAISFEMSPDSAREMDEFKDDFLSVELRHSRYGIDDLGNDPAAPPDVIELYSSLLNVATELRPIDSQSMASLLDRCRREYLKMAFLFPYINELERRLRRLKNEGGAQAEILALEQTLQEQRKWCFILGKTNAALSTSIVASENQNQALLQHLAQMETSATWRFTALLRRLMNWVRSDSL